MYDLPTGNWLLAGWVSSVWIAQDLPDFRLERFYNNYGDIFFGCHTHDCDRWFGNRKPNLLWGWDEASTWRWGLSHLQSHWGKRMRHLAREKGPPRFAWTVCADCAGEHGSSPICFLREKGSDINQVSHWPLARLKTSIFGGHSLWGREKGAVWPESTTHSRPRGSICQLWWKKCVNNALHLNGIHILEGIAVSLHVHAQGGKGLEERGIRQQQVRRGDGDSRQGCHHTILSLLK